MIARSQSGRGLQLETPYDPPGVGPVRWWMTGQCRVTRLVQDDDRPQHRAGDADAPCLLGQNGYPVAVWRGRGAVGVDALPRVIGDQPLDRGVPRRLARCRTGGSGSSSVWAASRWSCQLRLRRDSGIVVQTVPSANSIG